jgi:hypothetical protein
LASREQVNDDFYSAIKEGQSNNSINGTPNTLSRLQPFKERDFLSMESSVVMNPKVLASVEISLQSHRYIL